MPNRRDRHNRGMRGPLSQPSALTGRGAPTWRRVGREEFFLDCVDEAVGYVQVRNPGLLNDIDIGIEEVPRSAALWPDSSDSVHRVPLASAIEASADRPAQVVIFRRPLEHRAASRPGLRILVLRTLVEQVAALTGRTVDEIDPGSATEA